MKKYILSILVMIFLFSITGSVLAVKIDNPLDPINNFGDLLKQISTGISLLVGTLSVIMIIVAGIMYLVSAGDPQKVNTAKSALKYAIIGIVLSIIAVPIVDTIIDVLS
jgi:cytochrome bd-type quinol oxidase subunit 2